MPSACLPFFLNLCANRRIRAKICTAFALKAAKAAQVYGIMVMGFKNPLKPLKINPLRGLFSVFLFGMGSSGNGLELIFAFVSSFYSQFIWELWDFCLKSDSLSGV